MKKPILLELFLAFLVGCAAIPVSPDAPKISNFVVPSKIETGVSYKVSFDFEDPNGDISAVYFAWSGEAYFYPADSIWNQTKGTYSTSLITRRPGSYWLEVWVEDTKGHRSNRLHQYINVR